MTSKILVVDDEEDILELVRIILESEGYTVVTATSGEEALRLVESWKPSLVILDVVLPGVSGLDVCRQLRWNPRTHSVKVALFTALGTEVDMRLGAGDKADAYVLKPFREADLLRVVNDLLHGAA